MALGVVVIAQIMILLDATVVDVALPSAQTDLGFSDANQQWVITASGLRQFATAWRPTRRRPPLSYAVP
jgi:hypothetical protein